jgi:hypothetical protein
MKDSESEKGGGKRNRKDMELEKKIIRQHGSSKMILGK